jgi:hypothetical protein
MIDTRHFGESRRFNDGKGALSVREFVHTQSYLEVPTKNRKSQLLELIVTYSTEETIRQDKSVELCSSLQMLCTWCTITIPLVESL